MRSADTTSYRVYADESKTKGTGWGYFVHEFYVIPKAAQQNGSSACVFRVQATPGGAFLDQPADVSFTVVDGAIHEDGVITIILHPNSYSKPILEYTIDSAQLSGGVQEAGLNSETTVYVSVENPLSAVQVELTGNVQPTMYNSRYWRSPPSVTGSIQQTEKSLLGPKGKTHLMVALQPDAWHALGSSILPIGPGKSHDTIILSLDYKTPGGAPGTLEIKIPVQFRPSLLGLLLAMFIGTLVGSALGRCIPVKDPKDRLHWYQAYAVALLAAIMAEGIGLLVFVGGKSEFKLFEFELDPFQLLPAGIIGALVGLVAFRNARDILEKIGIRI
jgi:hypothetical protein